MIFLKQIAIIFFDIIDKFFHQPKILKYLLKNLKDLNLFIDIGSHKGTYTDLILKNFNVKKIYMFEPQKKIFRYFKKKYKRKNYIKIFNNAVSDNEEIQKIFINKHDLTSSLTKLDKKNTYLNLKASLFGGNIHDMISATHMIKCIKLINLIKKNKIKNIDLLKIDTEGHELQVMKGLGRYIKNVKYILIEFHNSNIYINYDPKKIHSYLTKNNFNLKEKFKFPFTTWEDRIYLNAKYQ